MKILAISDEECPALWDHYQPGRLREYDLILSCGDLKASYLSFLVTMARCPVLYVHGNHDTLYSKLPPEGCDCIDDHIVTFNGLRILGLGGCRRYHPGPHQYTEQQMRARISRLRWKLRLMGGVDIVVTHAPPEGLGDAEDPAHWGFAALRDLLDRYQPALLIHAHVHMRYGVNVPRELEYNGTRIINAYERYVIELPDRQTDLKDYGQVRYKTRRRSGGMELPLSFHNLR